MVLCDTSLSPIAFQSWRKRAGARSSQAGSPPMPPLRPFIALRFDPVPGISEQPLVQEPRYAAQDPSTALVLLRV